MSYFGHDDKVNIRSMKKENKKRYAWDWVLISARIKFERAKLRCEKCNLKDGEIIIRHKNGSIEHVSKERIAESDHWSKLNKKSILQGYKRAGFTRIVISVAHLDHNESNNTDSNLLAMCQRCHNHHDRQDNRFRSRFKKNDGSQLLIF